MRGNEKNIPLETNSSSLSFVAVRVVIFLYHARHHKYTYHLSLALSSRCFCGRSFFLSSLSKKDQQTRFGFLLIFCAQIGNFQRGNIIETIVCDVSPRAFVKSFLFPRPFCPLLFRERDAFRRARAEDVDGDSLLETDHLSSETTDTNYLHTQA